MSFYYQSQFKLKMLSYAVDFNQRELRHLTRDILTISRQWLFRFFSRYFFFCVIGIIKLLLGKHVNGKLVYKFVIDALLIL